MNQSVLMNTDIDKSAKVSHIRNHAFEHHASFQIANRIDLRIKFNRFKLISWISAWLAEFSNDVRDCWLAKAFANKITCVQLTTKIRIPDQRF